MEIQFPILLQQPLDHPSVLASIPTTLHLQVVADLAVGEGVLPTAAK